MLAYQEQKDSENDDVANKRPPKVEGLYAFMKLSGEDNANIRIRVVRIPVVHVGSIRIKVTEIDKVVIGRTPTYCSFPSIPPRIYVLQSKRQALLTNCISFVYYSTVSFKEPVQEMSK